MRRTAFMLLTVVLTLTLISCGNERIEVGEAFYNEVNTFEGVTLEIDQFTVTPHGAKFVVINTTDAEVASGRPEQIALQVEIDGQWRQMKVKGKQGAETALAYLYLKDEPRIAEASWASDYGILPAGHYRIVKGFFISNAPDATVSFMLADEFTISD